MPLLTLRAFQHGSGDDDITRAVAFRALLAQQAPDTRVVGLGGAVAAIITAQGPSPISSALRHEMNSEGDRTSSTTFGATKRQPAVELSAHWIHGTQEEAGPVNLTFGLALQHDPNSVEGNTKTSVDMTCPLFLEGHEEISSRRATYDANGSADYLDALKNAIDIPRSHRGYNQVRIS